MTEQIQEKLKHLPDAPGVYRMLDAYGRIIYIGKSKCLKKRVKSYFVKEPKWEKVKKMMPFIKDIDYTVTDTHLEARLLECELIKSIKPYFNVLMKQDGRYVYLKVEQPGAVKPLSLTDCREKDTFGPFRSRYTMQDVLVVFGNLYPLRKVDRHYEVEYHIFPNKMNEEQFLMNRRVLLELCRNPNAMNRFLKAMDKKMKEAAQSCRYETASLYRDAARLLGYVQKGLVSYQEWLKKKIYVDLPVSQGHKLFFIAKCMVIQKALLPAVSPEAKEEFIRLGKERMKELAAAEEKGIIDYRDIIYAELSALPAEQIEFID